MSTATQSRTPIPHLIAAIVFLIPLVYWSSLRDYTLGPKLIVWQILLALALGFWLFSKKPVVLHSVTLPTLSYVLLAFLSLTYATDPVAGLLEATKLLSGFILFFILTNHLSRANLSLILTIGIVTATLVSLLGLADHLDIRPFAIPSAGLPSATLGYRNIAAMYLIQMLPFVVTMFILTHKRSSTWGFALAFAFMGAFLIHTRTRGAWIGLVIAAGTTVILWYIANRKTTKTNPISTKHAPLIFAMVLLCAFAIIPPRYAKHGPQSIDEKKATLTTALTSVVQEGGDRGRLQTWERTLSLIADHPLLGVGLGNWSVIYPLYDHGAQITFDAAPERPHNDWLSITSELGLVGLACYLWFWLTIIRLGWHALQSQDFHTRWIAMGCLVSFMAISIHSFFSFPKERITPIVFFWFAAGMLAVLKREDRRLSIQTGRAVLVGLLLLVVAQIVLTGRVIAFDAHMYRAVRAERLANWKAVAYETEQAIAHGTFHPEAVHLRGYALNTLNQYNAAFLHYQAAIAKRPNDVQINNGLAIAAQNLGQFALAETHYLRVLNIVNTPDVRYNLAGLYLQSGNPQKAAQTYEQVLKVEGPSLDVLYQLTLAYLYARNPSKAAETIQRAFEVEPKSADRHFEWIEALYRKHRQPAIASACYALFIAHWPGSSEEKERAQKRLQTLQALVESEPK